MNDTSSVIILSLMDYKESDAMVKVFSDDYGLMTFIAKGLQKINSKNRMSCLPYNESSFMFDYKDDSNLQILHQGQMIQSNHGIHDNLEKSSIAALLVELSELLLKNETEPTFIKAYYAYLRDTFKLIATTEQHTHLLVYILIQFLNSYGIAPQVDGCVLCGSPQVNSISLEEGGFVCKDCQKEIQSPIYPLDILKDFRVVNKLDPTNIKAYLNYQAPTKALIRILVDFFRFHTGHALKSWDFIEKWSIIE